MNLQVWQGGNICGFNLAARRIIQAAAVEKIITTITPGVRTVNVAGGAPQRIAH